jgi:hypothetical protein
MRTTMNLDDQLLRAAKHRAIELNLSLTQVVENALRESLSRPQENRRECVQLVTCSGEGVKPGVDLDNSRSLIDIMDELT